jgi:hypothetical protein
MSKYHPWEIYMHTFFTFICVATGHWLFALVNIPMLLVNLKLLISKHYKFHFITMKEYS